MYADFLDNPELSDASLVLTGDNDDNNASTTMHAHMIVLYASARDYFKTTSKYTGVKRKTPDSDSQTAVPTFRIVGWKDDVRAARDFVEFMYCAFDGPGDVPNKWAVNFFKEADVTRVWDLMCTADAYGAKRIVDACMDHCFGDDIVNKGLNWKELFELPHSIQEDERVVKAVWKRLAEGTVFQRSYIEIAKAAWPYERMVDVLDSDALQLWSEDVVLEFILVSHDNHPLSSTMDWGGTVNSVLRVGRLTLRGLQILLRSPLAAKMTLRDRALAQNMACLWWKRDDLPKKWMRSRAKVSEEALEAMFAVQVDVHTLLDLPKWTEWAKKLPKNKSIRLPFATCRFVYRHRKCEDDTESLGVGIAPVSTTTLMETVGRMTVKYSGILEFDMNVINVDQNSTYGKKFRKADLEEDPDGHLSIALLPQKPIAELGPL